MCDYNLMPAAQRKKRQESGFTD